MADKVQHAFRRWIREKHAIHERAGQLVENTIAELARSADLELLSITHRTKDLRSALEKARRKGYKEWHCHRRKLGVDV